MKCLIRAMFMSSTLFLIAPAPAAPRYTVQNVSALVPGVQTDYWSAVNNSGDLLGGSRAQGALRYLNGTVQYLGFPYGGGSLALNNRGDAAIGWNTEVPRSRTSIYVQHDGNVEVIPPLVPGMAAPWVSATSINDSGAIAGIGNIPCSGEFCFNPERAIVYENGETRDLGTLGGTSARALDINNAGMVVGWSQLTTGWHKPFVYANGTMQEIQVDTDPFSDSEAVAINDAGQILGNSAIHAWIYQDGEVIHLADQTRAIDINGSGVAIGQLDRRIPWVYIDGEMHHLANLLLDDRYILHQVRDINDRGQILVSAWTHDETDVTLLLTPVPEPAQFAMLLGGFAAIALWRSRQRTTSRRFASPQDI